MIRAKVIVTLKLGVSDVQGITVQQTIAKLDYPELQKVRVGKYFELELDGAAEELRPKLDAICESVLSNPVIEAYEYTIEEI
jgi:phosphoribosylformylglycinamidine synthase PurS subunit